MTDQNSPQVTQTSTPDVGDGVEVPPDVSYPPDDDGTPVVDDTTEGGD